MIGTIIRTTSRMTVGEDVGVRLRMPPHRPAAAGRRDVSRRWPWPGWSGAAPLGCPAARPWWSESEPWPQKLFIQVVCVVDSVWSTDWSPLRDFCNCSSKVAHQLVGGGQPGELVGGVAGLVDVEGRLEQRVLARSPGVALVLPGKALATVASLALSLLAHEVRNQLPGLGLVLGVVGDPDAPRGVRDAALAGEAVGRPGSPRC